MSSIKDDTIKQIIGHIIRISQKYMHLEKKPQFFHPDIKIYPSQAQMLVTLNTLARVNITELAKHLNITKASVVETIGKLQKKRLVSRSKNPDNEKEVFVELSNMGKKICRKIMEHHEKIIEELIASIKEEKGLDYKKVCKMFFNIELFFDNHIDKSCTPVRKFSHP